MPRALENLHQVSLQRKFKNYFIKAVILCLSLIAIVPLFFVLYHVIKNGFPYLNYSFLTQLPKPVGELGGGMANALLGSLKLVGLATLITVPVGIAGGIYLTERSNTSLATVMRFVIDSLATVPSIVAGIFIYGLIVLPMKSFSGWAGSAALSFLMFPVMVKTAEEIIKLVPIHVKEAGLALGLPRWRVSLFIILRGCRPALTTGALLAIARVAGETAPLIFTAFGNQYWPKSMSQPTPSLPVQIYNYAISPFEEWHQKAWAGAFLLILTTLSINIISRGLMQPIQRKGTRR